MPVFSANLSMMYKEHEFLDRFAAAARDGFRFVEYLFPYDFDAGEIADRLKSAGITQSLFNLPPGDWDKGERGIAALPGREHEFAQGLEKALSYAEATGCKRLHVMAGRMPLDAQQRVKISDADRSAMRKTYLTNVKRAAQACAAHGITTLIEPINTRDMPGFYLNRTQQALDIIREVGSDNLFLQYDIYHMQVMEGDLAPTIERHLGSIAHMQLADTPGRHEPGTGEINYPFLFRHIDRLGYAGWIGCEYKPLTTTTEGLGWLKPWL